MNEADILFGVAAVAMGGYGAFLAGRYHERGIAKKAIHNILGHAMQSTSKMMDAMMSVVHARLPDVPPAEILQEVLNACAAVGIQAIAVDTETKQVKRANVEVKTDDNKAE